MELEDSSDIFIRFEVFHGEKLLGSMVQQAINFISLKDSMKSKQVLLLLPKEKEPEKHQETQEEENTKLENMEEFSDPTHAYTLSGTILINTLFVPDMKTRFEYDLYEDFSIYTTPEAKLHAKILEGTKIFDSYHFSMPTNFYDPQSATIDHQTEEMLEKTRPKIL